MQAPAAVGPLFDVLANIPLAPALCWLQSEGCGDLFERKHVCLDPEIRVDLFGRAPTGVLRGDAAPGCVGTPRQVWKAEFCLPEPPEGAFIVPRHAAELR